MSYLIIILFIMVTAQFFLYWRLEQRIGEIEDISENIADAIQGRLDSLQ